MWSCLRVSARVRMAWISSSGCSQVRRKSLWKRSVLRPWKAFRFSATDGPLAAVAVVMGILLGIRWMERVSGSGWRGTPAGLSGSSRRPSWTRGTPRSRTERNCSFVVKPGKGSKAGTRVERDGPLGPLGVQDHQVGVQAGPDGALAVPDAGPAGAGSPRGRVASPSAERSGSSSQIFQVTWGSAPRPGRPLGTWRTSRPSQLSLSWGRKAQWSVAIMSKAPWRARTPEGLAVARAGAASRASGGRPPGPARNRPGPGTGGRSRR